MSDISVVPSLLAKCGGGVHSISLTGFLSMAWIVRDFTVHCGAFLACPFERGAMTTAKTATLAFSRRVWIKKMLRMHWSTSNSIASMIEVLIGGWCGRNVAIQSSCIVRGGRHRQWRLPKPAGEDTVTQMKSEQIASRKKHVALHWGRLNR
jgi:hypothetical protein